MKSVVQLEAQLSARLPDLLPAQRTGLAYWVVGTVLVGTAFGPGRRRRCTLVAVWGAQMAAPWILLTDQPPSAVSLQVLAHGTRVEDAALLGRHPWHLTQAPATLPTPPPPRAVSVFRLGLTPLRRLCFQGRTWQGLWLRPESTARRTSFALRDGLIGQAEETRSQRRGLCSLCAGTLWVGVAGGVCGGVDLLRPPPIWACNPVMHSLNSGCCLLQHVSSIITRLLPLVTPALDSNISTLVRRPPPILEVLCYTA